VTDICIKSVAWSTDESDQSVRQSISYI